MNRHVPLLLAATLACGVLAAQEPAAPPATTTDRPQGLHLNFRGVPLDTVLDYLSRAGGFVIVRDEAVPGTVDIVSHQALSPDEAVELLHVLLNDRGYALLRTNRILRLVKRDRARTMDLPVHTGADPQAVPRTSEIVTQIVPVRHTNAGRLIDTLRPLLPEGASVVANEDSNALLITDTRTNINRLLQIVEALDTAVSSILDIKVVPLRYADAEEIADVVNKVYETPTQRNAQAQSASNRRAAMIARFRGSAGSGESDVGGTDIKQTASYIRAVADERANAVVVTAPTEILPQIAGLVAELDHPTEDVSTLRVFPLKFAAATEVANLLAGLYKQSTTNDSGSQRDDLPRWSRRGDRTPEPAATTASNRSLAEAEVVAVADTRTNSVIVSASRTTLDDIAEVLQELDKTPDNVPTVYIYQLENADVEAARAILDTMFDDLDQTGSSAPASSLGTTRATGNATTPMTPAFPGGNR